jgi:hypothetical protein
MAAALQKTENMHYDFNYIKSMSPCGNCNSEVLEEWNFRVKIVDQDPLTDVIYNEFINIPFYCECINGFFSKKELRKFVTDYVLLYIIWFDNKNLIKQLLIKHHKYINVEQINKAIISLDESNYCNRSNILKIFLEKYENAAPVNLKPAKR